MSAISRFYFLNPLTLTYIFVHMSVGCNDKKKSNARLKLSLKQLFYKGYLKKIYEKISRVECRRDVWMVSSGCSWRWGGQDNKRDSNISVLAAIFDDAYSLVFGSRRVTTALKFWRGYYVVPVYPFGLQQTRWRGIRNW